MAEPQSDTLRGRRLLVVEDEYAIATDLARTLEGRGVEVVGPAGSVEDALELVETEGGRLDGAVLDINLHDERAYPIADALRTIESFSPRTSIVGIFILGSFSSIGSCTMKRNSGTSRLPIRK